MRCRCCDKNLSDEESVRKHIDTGEYLDTCNSCLREIVSIVNIPFIGDLSDEENEQTLPFMSE